MEPIDVYGVITNGGDGSASFELFVTREAADKCLQQEDDGGFCEVDVEVINTYVDSKTHLDAIRHEAWMREDWAEDDCETEDDENDKIEEDDY